MAHDPIGGEPDLWRIWERRLLPPTLPTRDGRQLRVLFPGTANTLAGPDFTGAVLAFADDPIARGDVEVHVRASAWKAHGHHLDPRYNRVLLHVVLQDDGGLAWTEDNRPIPLLVLGGVLQAAGGGQHHPAGPCSAPDVARPAPGLVAQAMRAAGETRFQARAASWESEFAVRPAEDCILRGLLRTAGLGRNRDACEALADALDGPTLESLLAASGSRAETICRAVLLGMSGLLEAGHAGADLRAIWREVHDYWPGRPLDASRWQRFRLRPANLPEARLQSLAGLIAARGLLGLLERLVTLITQEPTAATAALVAALTGENGATGRAWALEALTNVILPLLAGYGRTCNQAILVDHVEQRYRGLPGGGDNRVLVRICAVAGITPPHLAIDQQGLLEIWERFCSVQDCAHCPFRPGP